MIVSHKHKFVFIKTRKTAGSTFENLMFPFLGKDDVCTGSARDGTPALNCELGTNGHRVPSTIPKGYFVFSIERNPWDKVVSAFYWHRNIKRSRFALTTFESYMETVPRKLLPMDWCKYVDVGDVVYRYEEMESMYEDINARLCGGGVTLDLGKLKTTRLKSGIREVADHRSIHTEKTRTIVSQLFHKEIEKFRYTY